VDGMGLHVYIVRRNMYTVLMTNACLDYKNAHPRDVLHPYAHLNPKCFFLIPFEWILIEDE
jgi:hypothetical protein